MRVLPITIPKNTIFCRYLIKYVMQLMMGLSYNVAEILLYAKTLQLVP